MSAQEELEALHKLTVAECRVLYYICHALSCKQIAQELVVTERTVYFHLGNIYDKLGLSDRTSAQRRLILGDLFCPLLDHEVSDPDKDCPKLRQPDREPIPEPSAETLALVKLDEQRSLIPIRRAIVPVEPKVQGKPPPEIIVVKRPVPPPPRPGGEYDLVSQVNRDARIEVRSDIFVAYRDGIKLLQVQDATLRNGRVGLAIKYNSDNTHRFDNLSVTALR